MQGRNQSTKSDKPVDSSTNRKRRGGQSGFSFSFKASNLGEGYREFLEHIVEIPSTRENFFDPRIVKNFEFRKRSENLEKIRFSIFWVEFEEICVFEMTN
jgi:hypothetical protein